MDTHHQTSDETTMTTLHVVFPPQKRSIAIRIDEDVLAYFRKAGPGYQTRMNAILRAYCDAKGWR